MIILWLFLTAMIFGMIGVFVGARLGRDGYNGVLRIRESPEGLRMDLELAGDPELLVFQDSVSFKVIPPDYEELLGRSGN